MTTAEWAFCEDGAGVLISMLKLVALAARSICVWLPPRLKQVPLPRNAGSESDDRHPSDRAFVSLLRGRTSHPVA
jgi:hypothetical protein